MKALSWRRPISSAARILMTFMTATPDDRTGFYPPLWARRLFVFTAPISYPLGIAAFAVLMVLFILETILVGFFTTMGELLEDRDNRN